MHGKPRRMQKIHYSWAMVVMAFCYSVFSSAAMGVPSILILPMAQDLGWSIAELSAPQGARIMVFGVVTPFAGGLMLRFGLRKTFAISGVLLIAGLLLSINMTQKWHLWLGMGMLLGIAPGLVAMQISSVIATRWFVERCGLVVGILSGSVANGTLIFLL